jgi:hypothetical protein
MDSRKPFGLAATASPAMVPPLKESAEREGGKILSMRERMEEHRQNPACSGCHSIMDPIGFAMENFDAVGAWRTKESRVPIDASGQLLDGTKVNGIVELKKVLLRRPETFVATFTEKMMTYALGRGWRTTICLRFERLFETRRGAIISSR